MRFWSQYSLYSSGNLKQLWLIICLFYCWVVDKSYSCTWWWFLQYGKKIQRSEYHKSAFVVYVFSWKVSVLNYKHPFNTICLSAALIRDLPSLLAKSAITQLVMGFKLSSSAKQENQKRFREQTVSPVLRCARWIHVQWQSLFTSLLSEVLHVFHHCRCHLRTVKHSKCFWVFYIYIWK